MLIDPVEILKQLVAIPSVNPMGPDCSEAITGEGRLATFLENTLRRMGLTAWRQPVLPGRDNVIGLLEGDVSPSRGGRVILFDAHQDTVPVDGMTIDPFDPREQDGRIYGRGACDVKGGMASMLAAVAQLADQRPGPLPTIIVSCTADEENGFRGVARLTEQWDDPSGLPVLPRPDAAIVLEPTGLDTVVAHKGMMRWKIHTHGRAAHSAYPQSGENAIYKMGRVLGAIEAHAAQLAEEPSDAHCGAATLSVGTIDGGAGVNTVPDRCTIEVDLRPLPGGDPLVARQRLIDAVSTLGILGVEHEPPFAQGPSLADTHNGPLAERLIDVTNSITGSCRRAGMSCCTDAPFFAAMGVPTVVFGPGFLEQAHTADEWIEIDQLQRAVEILSQLCLTYSETSGA